MHIIKHHIMITYLTSHFWIFWLLICVLCLILEISTGTFYLLCFSLGALVGVVAAGLQLPFWLQVLFFVIGSAFSILCIRPLAMKYLHRGEDSRTINMDALIGRIGVVIEDIEAHANGYVKVDGDEWKAVSADCTYIEKGAKVRIIAMDSIIVTVEKVDFVK